jgi:GNAT superfamily N-acetyltransferase
VSEELDALADSARNRGLKLVRSRVRTPGKRGFGKVGVTDPSGKPLFGMDDKGPNATPEQVADYLRHLGARDWGASLDVAVLPRRKPPKAKPKRAAANDTDAPVPTRPSPPPAPKLELRPARPADAAAIASLISLLQHEIGEPQLKKNLSQLAKLGEPPIVATLDKQVVGLCGVHKMVAIHRPAPVGRITILVVAHAARDRGVGRLLVEAAEQWCRDQGCALLEVTSHDRLTAAHAFYRHLGFERTSLRFAKTL